MFPPNVPVASTSRTSLRPGHAGTGGGGGPQSLLARLGVVVLVPKAAVPLGQRPYVVAACAVHEWASTIPSEPLKSRAESAAPSPKPNCASSSVMNAPAASEVPAGITYAWVSSLSLKTWPPRLYATGPRL